MEFEKNENRFFKNDESGKMIAEVTYVPSGEDKVILDHTFVDPSLRGQGIAAQLVDRVVEEMENEGKKIVPLEKQVEIFELIENELNLISTKDGFLRLSVPFVIIDSNKQ